MRPTTSILLTMLLLAGCAPAIKPHMKAATDALLAAAPASRTLEAPASYEPMPWQAGHWVVLKVEDAKTGPSVMRLSIVGEGVEGVWVETEIQDYYDHTISKVLYARMPRTAEEAIDLMQQVVTKQGDEAPQTIDFGPAAGPAAAMMKGMMRQVASGIVAPSEVASMPREDVAVPAGLFKAAARHPASARIGPYSQESTGWFHPGVPVNGAVRGVANDGSFTMELLDFGLTGASSRL